VVKPINPMYAGWAVGTMGASLLLNTFSVATMFFLVTVLKVDPLLAGSLIMVSKLYDAASDPVMGYISDRTRSRWGRRRPYLLIGGIVSGISFAALFAAPVSDGSTAHTVLVAGLLIFLSTGYTIFNVPYLAMPAEMIDDYHQRSVLMSYRVFLISLGTFAGISGAPALVGFLQDRLGQSPPAACANMGIVVGLLIALFMMVSFFGTRNARATAHVQSAIPLKEQLLLLWGNRPFLIYLGIKLAGLFALAAIISTQFFFVVYVLERSVSVVALFGLMQLAGKLLSIPAWLALARRRGKAWILAASTLLFIPLAASWLFAMGGEPLWVYAGRGLLLGVASAGTLLGTQAMLPDIMEYDYLRSGMRREGIYAGVASFIEKTAYALAGIVIGGFLSAMQFDKSLPPGSQPDSALLAIIACTALVPICAYVAKLLLLWFYDLDEAKLRSARDGAASGEAQPAH
jgi:GPH family glycoside/pentoside/hexuronide:cation symporter